MKSELVILYQGDEVARLQYERQRDKLNWVYQDDWFRSEQFFPASLSLQQSSDSDETIRHFLKGLLPDNPEILASWGKRFHVSPRNPFGLLENVGEDCAGALQFVRPERTELILSGKLDQLIPLNDEQLEKRISDLRMQEQAIPLFDSEGHFSLAGAQTKDALHLKEDQWHRPLGNIPTTHILKPQLREYENHSLNEHTCLALAKGSGLPTAKSFLTTIGVEEIICVERYDRQRLRDGTVTRIHQEDFCQALAIDPENKYQNQGGPTPNQVISLLSTYSSSAETDINHFLQALALNWAIAGTDAHAKNYSILHAPGGFLRLAPLYDLASYLPYRDPKSRKTKMAMKYGHTYHLHKIDRRQWETLAAESKLKPKRVLPLVSEYLEKLREESLPTTHALIAEKHACDFLDILVEQITAHTNECLDSLAV
ncbi:HipA domain-containing protein [Roseibacillus persicicus]|uniref:Kinase Y4mE n=1 Tax=Roseibacillus persicicus TaxID=454148 RepID=A0A918THC7_9BACT|nr:HipA domain-containing protein [Roseibacillus persicicus]GHC46128.1 putative kinase Y4mE [Roseibacillus persicicus]